MSTNTPSTKSGWGYRIGAAVQHAFSVLTSRPSTSFIGSLEQINASLGSTQDLLLLRPPTLLAPSTIMKPPTREAASIEDLCSVEPAHRPPSSSASQIPAAPSPRLTATLIHEATFEKEYPRVQHTLSPGIFTGLPQHVATMDPPADYSPLLNTARRSTIFNLIAESSAREVASTGDHSPINPSLAECGLPLVMGSPVDGPGEFTEELEELPQHVVSPASRSPSPPMAPHPAIPSSTIESLERKTSFRPQHEVKSEETGRDRNDLRGAVREASRDSVHEAAREFASPLAQDTRPPTPADGHASPILGSSAADKPLRALTGKRDNLPQLAIIIDPTHLSPPISEPGPSANAPNTPQAESNPRRWIESVSTPPKPRLDPRIWRDRGSLPLETPERNAKEKEAIIPSDRDEGGRSRTSSIHLPHDDPFADPIGPATDLSRRDELSPYIFGLYKQVGETGPGGDDNVITPISANVGHPRSIQDASARSIATGSPTRYGFDTSETRPSLTPENISYHPDYATGPPSEQFMVLGVRHSTLSSGRGPSRRRTLSPQGPEQDKVGGDGQTRKWTVPISRDSCLSDARWQQNPGGPPDEAYGVIPDFEAQEPSPFTSPSSSRSSSGYDSHLPSPANPRAIPSPTRILHPQRDRQFHAHGWVEHSPPKESLYYAHQGYKVIVDMDLSDEKILSTVMAYLKDRGDGIPPGKELWLRDMGSCEDGFVPLRWLVDHAKQLVIFDSSQEANGDRGGYHTYHTDDQLDAEYRYWSFMKTHPAHASLPPVAHQYAMAALDWDSTNGLIHPHSSLPTFTQEECQVFTALLQSIHERGETPLRTRTVSKILLRVVRWNQSHSRPDKPLPVDAGCYGPRRTDHSMLAHSGSPSVLTTGVHACLAAVIALSPSKIARITGVGALLFSLSSNVVSNAAIITQFKMDSNGSLTSRARRAMSMFSPVTNSWPPWRMAGVPSGRSSTLDTVPTTGENST